VHVKRAANEESETMQLPSDFLTFTTYGTWLHGDARGSVDRDHNIPGTPFLEPDEDHRREMRERMVQPPYALDAARRVVVLEGIRGLFSRRGWELDAIHVRSQHVHVVGAADRPPERVMHDCKSFASKALNDAGFDTRDRRRWTRGGSTKWINDLWYFDNAVRYVLDEQGTPLARWPENVSS
jgi:hypothetical protein